MIAITELTITHRTITTCTQIQKGDTPSRLDGGGALPALRGDRGDRQS